MKNFGLFLLLLMIIKIQDVRDFRDYNYLVEGIRKMTGVSDLVITESAPGMIILKGQITEDINSNIDSFISEVKTLTADRFKCDVDKSKESTTFNIKKI